MGKCIECESEMDETQYVSQARMNPSTLIFSTTYKTFYYCMNEECSRAGLVSAATLNEDTE